MSQALAPLEARTSILFIRSTQSVYGILRLNETMPGFMTMNYILEPFQTLDTTEPVGSSGTWTSSTSLFGVDLDCREIKPNLTDHGLDYKLAKNCTLNVSNWGTHVVGNAQNWVVNGRGKGPGMHIMTYSSALTAGEISRTGWWPDDPDCVSTLADSFFTAFLRKKEAKSAKDEDSTLEDEEHDNPNLTQLIEAYNNITAIACKPHYERQAEATVDAKTKTPIDIKLLGPKISLVGQTFNASMFKRTLMKQTFLGGEDVRSTDGLPDWSIPRYLSALYGSNLTLFQDWAEEFGLHPLAAMVYSTTDRALEELRNSRVLAAEFDRAYQLQFARAMNSFLDTDFSNATVKTAGKRYQRLNAVTLQPVFTYIVEALLAVLSLSMGAILYFSVTRKHSVGLCDDPGIS